MTDDISKDLVSKPQKKAETRPPKPQAMTVMFDGIPTELRQGRRFVLWRYIFRDGRWTKAPFRPDGRTADTTDPATWSTLDEVRHAYERGGFDGIGIVHRHEDNIVGADADHCIGPETGKASGEAAEAVLELDSYVEVSPSGTGLRAFCRGRKPGRLCRKGAFELYDGLTSEGKAGGRYLTLTGCHYPGTPTSLNDRQAQVEAVYRRMLEPGPKSERKTKQETPKPGENGQQAAGCGPFAGRNHAPGPIPLDDAERARWRCLSDDKRDKILALWDGDVGGHDDDDSRADGALCAFFFILTNGDRTRTEKLFDLSALSKRPKWADRPDYRSRTLDLAARNFKPWDPDPAYAASVKVGGLTLAAAGGREFGTRGQVAFDVRIEAGGKWLSTFPITSTPSSWKPVLRTVQERAGPGGSAGAEAALGRLIVAARRQAHDAAGAGDGAPPLLEVLRAHIPPFWDLRFRCGKNAWSEARRMEVGRADFTSTWPPCAVLAAQSAGDAPAKQHVLLSRLPAALNLLWSDLQPRLPEAADAGLTPDSAAAAHFTNAIMALWRVRESLEVIRSTSGESVNPRASIAGKARKMWREVRERKFEDPCRWHEVVPGLLAYFRPCTRPDDGQPEALLGFRWELAAELRRSLPWVNSHEEMELLGRTVGAFRKELPSGIDAILPSGLSFAVLAPHLTSDLLADPETTQGHTPQRNKPSEGDPN